MNRKKSTWKPVVSSDCKLIGPLPEIVDLSNECFPDQDFSQEPRFIISGDPHVKKSLCHAMQLGSNI